MEQSLEQLGRLKEELHHQALHDPLTGLANRSLFTQVVASRLEARDPSGTVPIVLFVDLDDFKLVNDSLGHAAGDALLVAVGDRLGSVLRSSDMAARLGGDEFAVLLRDTPDMKASMRVANRLTAAMGSFFEIEGRDVNVRASVGVAAGRPGIESAGDLLRNADVAMYSAKARGKGRVVVFEPSMHEAVMARAQLSADLEHAISAREFVLQYQPIVEIATGRMVGVEALVRWEHPERGRIGPDDFIRVAEESDSILEIGRWVLSQACRQVRAWHDLVTPGVHRERQHLGQAAGPARLRRRGAGDHPRGWRRAIPDRARDDRDVDAPGQCHDAGQAPGPPGRRASASRSTISGPAIRRSATSSASR